MKTFSVEEVANTIHDCWVIVDGKVFDLTKFVSDHPGGKNSSENMMEDKKSVKTVENMDILPGTNIGIGYLYYTESHIVIRKVVREFTNKEVLSFCHEWSEAKVIPRQVVMCAAELGILNAVSSVAKNSRNTQSVKYSLSGSINHKEFDIFHEFIGWFCLGFNEWPWYWIASVLNFGPEELMKKIVPRCLAVDKFIVLTITGSSGGSNVANL
ncbi:hypothetical protein K501DRAFT_269827 [Backusella circina FSU 941]|nr:hypothetical protein K501DRAFT_269827 [Backusella circina FSU 941]